MKSVCIIGGGASALMCACFASNCVKVTILEKADKVGKKILATGNGRCNLTNQYMSKYSYNHNIDEFLQRFSSKDTIDFFNQIGLEVYADEEGRVYPFSNSAVSVLDVLNNFLKQKSNVEIKTGVSVLTVEHEQNGYRVEYNQTSEHFDYVVIATGNCTDLKKLNNLAINTKPFAPSLCALSTPKQKNLAGVRVDNVKVVCPNVGFEEIGEVLFKQDAISGIVIFNLSAYFARRQSYSADVILDFLPNVSLEALVKKLTTRRQLLKNYLIDDFLSGFFIKQLNFDFLTKLGLNVKNQVQTLTDKDVYNLARLIKNYKVKTLAPQNNNQVCSGGVCLSSLDNNLQVKNRKGLFIIGEAVDVDGICGGYNLQWAWTSGKIVGESL